MLDNINIEDIINIAKEAGDAIMKIYQKDFSIEYKDDKSPLTEADLVSHKIIAKVLERYQLPILSEEGKEIPYEERKAWEYYWCIDPIDGTKEFIKKNDEFTVNIALIHNDTPVLGVVYAPALGDMYFAKKGMGAYKNGQKLPLKINQSPAEQMTIVASKSHLSEETQQFIDNLTSNIHNPTFISKGSSLKLCMVAEGDADIYPRLAPTMEWDTAAADAVVRESGKITYQYHSAFNIQHLSLEKAVVYNKPDLLNPWFVVKG
jgi:3'(2'), 5'-bisphosphate nucleotidase